MWTVIMQSIIDLYRKAEDYFFRGISSECLNIDDSANVYMTRVSVADLNPVVVTKNTVLINETLRLCENFYDKDGLSFIISVRVYCMPARFKC